MVFNYVLNILLIDFDYTPKYCFLLKFLSNQKSQVGVDETLP